MIDVRIEDTSNQLRLRLDGLPRRLEKRLEAAIRPLTHELERRVEAKEPVRTGLLRKQTRSYVDVNRTKNFVRGRVRILNAHDKNIAAAFGALEYGSTGKKFDVKAYTRRGRPVRAYERRGGIKAQRYLRDAAAIVIPKARRELRRVLSDEIKG